MSLGNTKCEVCGRMFFNTTNLNITVCEKCRRKTCDTTAGGYNV